MARGFQLCGGAQTPEHVQHPKGTTSLRGPSARWAGANLTELPAVLGGLRQPCSATRGRGFCPQLVQGRAEPAAEG